MVCKYFTVVPFLGQDVYRKLHGNHAAQRPLEVGRDSHVTNNLLTRQGTLLRQWEGQQLSWETVHFAGRMCQVQSLAPPHQMDCVMDSYLIPWRAATCQNRQWRARLTQSEVVSYATGNSMRDNMHLSRSNRDSISFVRLHLTSASPLWGMGGDMNSSTVMSVWGSKRNGAALALWILGNICFAVYHHHPHCHHRHRHHEHIKFISHFLSPKQEGWLTTYKIHLIKTIQRIQ